MENGVVMEEVHVDRRIRKTKNALWTGLARLMQDRDINEISVKDLTESVDINRSTFYTHYKDIYDLLSSIEDELFEEFERILTTDIDPAKDVETDTHNVLIRIYQNLNDRREISSAFLGPHSDTSFINRLQDLLSKHIDRWWQDNTDVSDFYTAFCFSGCIGIIRQWIKDGYKKTPEEMAKITTRLLINGID